MTPTFLASLLVACGGSEPQPAPPAPAVDPALGLGWVGTLAFHSDQFAGLTAAHRDGWVKLHANDPDAAWSEFRADPKDEVGLVRAAWAQGVLHEDLAGLSGLVHETLWTRWSAAKGVDPMPPQALAIAALAAACTGRESAATWAARAKEGDDAALATVIASARSPFLGGEGGGPVGRRVRQHRLAMEATDPEPLLQIAGEPVWSEPIPEKPGKAKAKAGAEPALERTLWDPCLDATLSRIWLARAGNTQGNADPARSWKSLRPLQTAAEGTPAALGAAVFAAWGSTVHLGHDLPLATRAGEVGARSTGELGVSAVLPPTDDPEAARTVVRGVDATLDAWKAKITDQAPDDGEALVTELGAAARYRQQWLLTRARVELAAGHPRIAETLVQLAEDRDRPGIGPGNDPSVYVLRAHALAANGHLREALDALHPVAEAFPHVRGLAETLSDLVVLDGLGKPGDSKEDP